MAITLNVAGYADSNFANPPYSILPLTVGAGSDKILVIAAAWLDEFSNPGSDEYDITYDDGQGGGPVTVADEISLPPLATSDPYSWVTMLYVLDPPAGNIQVELSTPNSPGSLVCFVLNNVLQSNPCPAGVLFHTGNAAHETQTLSASSDSNNIWQVAFGAGDGTTEYPVVADVGQTQAFSDPGGVQYTYCGLSYQPASGSPPIIGGWTKGGAVDVLSLLSYGVMNEAGGATGNPWHHYAQQRA